MSYKDICILSDFNYLTYGITLIDSLLRTSSVPICIHYLCMDDKSYKILNTLYNNNIVLYNENILLEKNKQLQLLKDTHYIYYLYTLSSEFTKYLIDVKKCESVTYIDSDICFHKDIQIIYNEIKNKDVGIFKHRFPEGLEHNAKLYGEFNVGVVYFKNSKKGREVLNWWNDAVLYKKYPELANCGDQQYLDMFPKMCSEDEIYIDDNIGHGAPWNWRSYSLDNIDNYKVIYKGQKQPYVFSHFSKFKYNIKSNTYTNSPVYNTYTNNGNVYHNKKLIKLHDEYFNNIKISNQKIRLSVLKKIKIAVGMIVFEGDYVIKECIKQIYPHVNQILISEGPVKYWQNKGRTTSTDNTNSIIDNYPDPDNKIKVIHGMYNEKNEQANAYCKYIEDDTDYLWMIDSDEVYKTLDILKLKEFLLIEQPTSIGIKSCTFYGGLNHVLTGFENNTDNFIRVFKFMKGSYWASHRPPTLYYNTLIQRKHITSDELFNKTGIQFYHYSYVFPNQVKKKIDYYANSGVFISGGVIDNYFNEVYLKWVLGNDNDKSNIENKYQGVHEYVPQRRGDCYTEYFGNYHPESIIESINSLRKIFDEELYIYTNNIHDNINNMLVNTTDIQEYNIVNEWKHEELPKKLLELNMYELDNKYPEHWKNFLNLLNIVMTIEDNNFTNCNLIDLGCGVGTTYKLLKDNNIQCEYIGYDFSFHMINTAKNAWNYNNFYVKDITTLTDISDKCILYCTGLLDNLENACEVLDKILQYNAPYVILNRININKTSYIKQYRAYDIINCIDYTFSKEDFENIIKNNNYSILSCLNNTSFLLVKNKI